MSAYNIPARGRGTAQVVANETVTASDTTALTSPSKSEPTCVEIFVAVSVAGDVVLVDWGGNAATYTLTVGNHWISGHFKLIKSTGLTATATFVARYATA